MQRPASILACLMTAALLVTGCGLGDDERPTPQLILEGAGDAELPGDAPPPTFPNTATTNTVRVAGRDAVEDAAGVASAVFPATDEATRPEAVVLVDREDWQGGVAAAVLASGEVGAPILLTDGDEVPAVTSGTLARLDPQGAELAENAQVIRIGEDAARPDGFETAVIEGQDPFELAAAIDRFHATAEGERSGDVVIASADDAEYAMPAAAWAARSGDAVLFTEPDALPEATRTALEEHEEPDIYVLGPESVISEAVVGELEDMGGEVNRIEGETPVENAIEFARYRNGDFGWGLITPGHNFTLASTSRPLDAAAAAPLASGGTFAPLLLTDAVDELPAPLREYFLDVQPGFEENPNLGVFNRVWILGDQDTVSLSVQAQIDELTELIPVQIEDEPPDDGGGGGGIAPLPGPGGPQTEPEEPLDGFPSPPPGGDDLPNDVGPGGIPAPQGPGISPG